MTHKDVQMMIGQSQACYVNSLPTKNLFLAGIYGTMIA